MIIFVNPHSAAGTALKKWKRVIQKIPSGAKVFYLSKELDPEEKIKESISSGEYEFVAAGGDGTVNLILNGMISAAEPGIINKLKLGAIGLGSSNDFHKPALNKEAIPFRINFNNAQPRDVPFISFKNEDKEITKYFLINASLGITADANYFFNNPGYILKYLKKINTNLAIICSALHTIIGYQNTPVKINCREKGRLSCFLTNLGVVKNPHFSGNLSYHGSANYNNGKFNIHLCYNMNLWEIIFLFLTLNFHRFNRIKKKVSWKTPAIEISSAKPFNVEFDGEVVHTNRVKFDILPEYLRVCND